MPFNALGIRDPPMSEPIAIVAIPADSEAAEPPRRSSWRIVPIPGLRVIMLAVSMVDYVPAAVLPENHIRAYL